MSNPSWIVVEIEPYLNECPPYDEEITGMDVKDLAQEVARRFDSSPIFNQIDEIALCILRERGLIS